MTAKPKIKSDGRTITVRVPISFRRRGGRHLVLAPDGSAGVAKLVSRVPDEVIIKAVSRAFRWREALEKGLFSTITELAEAEKINESYVSRILRLTLLSPATIEAIVAGKLAAKLTLKDVVKSFSPVWADQERALNLRS